MWEIKEGGKQVLIRNMLKKEKENQREKNLSLI